jgi:hypothetical protein
MVTSWFFCFVCAKKRPLTFNARYKIKYALNRAKDECMYPMKLDTIKSKYHEMYEEAIQK